MSYKRKRVSEYQLMQQIFLGGEISQLHEEFKDLTLVSVDFADAYIILKKLPELMKLKDDPLKFLTSFIKYLGMSDNTKYWSELTRLSAIKGDTREHFDTRVKDKPEST